MPNSKHMSNHNRLSNGRRLKVGLAAQGLTLLFTLATYSLVQGQDDPFQETVRRSGFIFIGTVEVIGKATATIVPRANSAVVVVDSILEALPPVGNPTGQKVTVHLRNPQTVRVGDQFAFFTYVQTAGETLGLVEVARDTSSNFRTLRQRIAAMRRTLADEVILARLKSAEFVVVGVVGKPEPTEASLRPLGEHDPLWWRAPIRVETFEKGRSAKRSLDVYFATNVDYKWAETPKLEAEERGIFLLQPDPEKRYRVTGLFLTHRFDKLPIADLGRVRRLLRDNN